MAKAKKDDIPEENTTETENPTDDCVADSQETSAENEMETALKAEKDKYLRLAAEYDNYRKRSIKERESLYNDIRSDTIVRLLPVYDNLTRALSQECTDEAFLKGVELTMSQLKDILDNLGVKAIQAVGEPFDPDMHNAVMHIDDPDYGEAVVVEEFEKGFMLGDKVIRFSMVKVAN